MKCKIIIQNDDGGEEEIEGLIVSMETLFPYLPDIKYVNYKIKVVNEKVELNLEIDGVKNDNN